MAAKNGKPLSIAEIEKNIERLTVELHKARMQKVTDTKETLRQAKAAVMLATSTITQLTATGSKAAADKARLKKAQLELSSREKAVALAEENFEQAKTALEIATACANEMRNDRSLSTKKPSQSAQVGRDKQPQKTVSRAGKTPPGSAANENDATATKSPTNKRATKKVAEKVNARSTDTEQSASPKNAPVTNTPATNASPKKPTGKNASRKNSTAENLAEQKTGSKKVTSSPDDANKASATDQTETSPAGAVQVDIVPETPPSSTSETRRAIAEAVAAPQSDKGPKSDPEKNRADTTKQSENNPKPLPVDQDENAANVHHTQPRNTPAAGHTVIAQSDNPLPKPEPV
jgi:hypothetical protein